MTRERTLSSRMLREVRKAEAEARENNVQDVGTGFTIIKLKGRNQPPIRTLVEAKRIGATELQAADQIALAASSVASGGILHAVDLVKVSRGRQNDNPWPAHVAVAVRNYQDWQRHWTHEWNLTRNPMLECIWSAVIDERPLSVIAQEIGYGRHLTTKAIIAGLRHYAAHAHMVTGTQADQWTLEAQHVFDRRLIRTTN